ncbi:MAG: lysylphosphatidylglycerol synthase transmembrane domain-containing protein [Candidatus Binatia bacterium]
MAQTSDATASEGAAGTASPKRWKLLLRLGVSVGLLVYLFRLVDGDALLDAFSRVRPEFVVAAYAVFVVGAIFGAAKWRLLARAAGLDGTLGEFAGHYFVGQFFNVFGLGTVGGDVVRGLALAGPRGRRGLALNTVLADRVSGLMVLLAIALVSLLLFRNYDLPAPVYWTTLALSAGLLAGWRIAPRVLPLVFARENSFRRLVEHDLAPYWNDWALLRRVSALSALFHFSQIAAMALLASGLHLAIPATYFFIFGPLVNIFSSLPISVNGLGIREGGYVFFLTHVGVARESAIAFALLYFGIVLASGLIGGVIILFRGRVRASAETGRATSL